VSLPAPTAETTLLPWLLDALHPMKRTHVKQLLRHGCVVVNGAATTRHDFSLHPGDHVVITPGTSADRTLDNAGIAILLEDDALIVIDKPPRLLTVATDAEKIDTAFARLNAHLTVRGQGRPFIVHRLDRETSGLLLFARSAAIRDQVQANWDQVTKTYLAIVEGKPRQVEGTIETFLKEGRDLRVRSTRTEAGARRAVTHYRVVAERGPYTLLEVRIETGRKHQIRVHLAGIGCPVIGDPVYGAASNPAGRLGLHAHRLKLVHPTTAQPLELESPLPMELRRLME
jgi:23S rRNA pseudouridine1911/1915/1917 synthase